MEKRKKARGTVSINRGLFEEFKRYCKALGVPKSAFLEGLITATLGKAVN